MGVVRHGVAALALMMLSACATDDSSATEGIPFEDSMPFSDSMPFDSDASDDEPPAPVEPAGSEAESCEESSVACLDDPALAAWALTAAAGSSDDADVPTEAHIECMARYVAEIDRSQLQGIDPADPEAALAALGLEHESEIFGRALYCVSFTDVVDGIRAAGVDVDDETVDCLHESLSLDDIAGLGVFGSAASSEIEATILGCLSDRIVASLLES